MLYELRTYEAATGKMGALQRRFRDHTVGLFAKHEMQVVGFWTYAVGGPSDQLVYMMAFPSVQERDRKWAEFQADPEWQEARRASEAEGPLVARIHVAYLTATDFSPLK